MNKPSLLAEIVFLSPAEGGRPSPPILGTGASYRPHLVAQDRSVRHARMQGNAVDENYFPITFVEGPKPIVFGEAARFVLRLDYFPDVDYAAFVTDASFTVREGACVVAHGVVLERRDAG